MKKYILLLAALFLICNSQIANATDIIFQNNTKHTQIAYLDWVKGHPFKRPWPVNIAAGEVRAGERWVIKKGILNDPKNLFLITWRNRGDMEISFWLKGGPALVEVFTTKDCIGLAF